MGNSHKTKYTTLDDFRRTFFPEPERFGSEPPVAAYEQWPHGEDVADDLLEEVARETAALADKN